MAAPERMLRLLQGDVGSGKTVVALYAMLMAVADRKQAAIMSPTELLAEQHELSLRKMLEGSSVRIALLTGQRQEAKPAIAVGEVDLIVGTHALLSASVKYHDLAVVVIDEQHRFGVMQRAALREPMPTDDSHPEYEGKFRGPHTLVMTATPIPRTLSLTLLGDLDITTLTGLPPGRVPIQNRVVGPEQADDVYTYTRSRLERGEQVYVVVPAIEAGQGGDGAKLKSVNQHAKLLQQKYFDGYQVGVVHGRLKSESRRKVMDRFREGNIDVLVATTVIEVGVDVPNASVMIIEHAERFGLAQLHQLRGRIGRGASSRRPLCVFIADPTTDDAIARMEAIGSTNDGFKLAEMDLQIRGMGEILGTRQSGAPPMKLANLPDDLDLLKLAKRDAMQLIEADPTLDSETNTLLRRVLLQQYGESLGLVDVA
jgi:ATP-dependent DNA helicase RecG